MRFVRTAENLFGLPLGFTRVEYLQSTGTQYIDTGIIPSGKKISADLRFQYTDMLNSNASIIGSVVNDGNDNIQFGILTSKWRVKLNNFGWVGVACDKNIHKVILNAENGSTLDNTNITSTQYTIGSSNTAQIRLFQRNGGVGSEVCYAKIFYCKIYDNGTLVRDFIPCIDPLGVACMYDLVGKKPYYNQGTGTFTVGRQVIPVEYLESTGTQYIDCGVPLTQNDTCEVVYSPVYYGYFSGVFGSRDSANSKNFASGDNASSPYITADFNNSDYATYRAATPNLPQTGSVIKVIVNKNERLIYVNDVLTASNTTICNDTFTTPSNCLLFKTYGVNPTSSHTIRVYRFKIYDKRDFIPCKDENNVGFMFDKVSSTCYLNAGTGAFSVGENKYTSKLRLIKDAIRLPEGYTRVEYLESTGTQYINTGYIPTNTTGVQVRHTICADNSSDNIIFGCREGVGDTRFWEDIDWTNTDTIGWGFNGYSSIIEGDRFPISGMAGQTVVSSLNFMNDRAGCVNGVRYDTSLKTKTLVSITKPICLFAANNGGTISFYTACKIFGCKISEGSTLVRSFIPVRDENNVGYMFDEVTGQLFGNAGSGSFVIGNDLQTAKVRFIQDVLPREYRPLKYLQSTGTQYIDTGVSGSSTLKIEMDGQKAGAAYGVYFGAGTGDNRIQAIYLSGYNSARIGNVAVSQLGPDTEKFNVVVDALNKKVIYNGTTHNFAYTTTLTNLNIYLFTRNEGSALADKATAKCWKCIIWDNGVPVRDFYPALRKSDNKPGMYDRITKQFFTNDATSGNDFNYG